MCLHQEKGIHDNFLYVRSFARRLHKRKTSSLLSKLDIHKAFESVHWDYILDLLHHRGFQSRFRDWVTVLLHTSSSQVRLNGVTGSPIMHGRRLLKEDTLSPLLFVIVIDLLQQILKLAKSNGLCHKFRGRDTIVRTSLYADDALFPRPPSRVILITLLASFVASTRSLGYALTSKKVLSL